MIDLTSTIEKRANELQLILPREVPDAFQFLVADSNYVNIDATPFQRLIIKLRYNLFEQYPPDEEEQRLIKLEKDLWGITLPLTQTQRIKYLTLIVGRRGTKSTISAMMAANDMKDLICLGNPQQYYGMQERYPIHILHVAAKESQAQDMFAITKNIIKGTKFFDRYINFKDDNTQELGFFSPYDLLMNERIKRENLMLPRGVQRKNLLPGSLKIESVTTSGATNRGKAIKTLILSELAHFQFARTDDLDSVYSSSNQTDHAIVTALVPSVKDFGEDGVVIIETSPSIKAGEAYKYYCLSGGKEQDLPEGMHPDDIKPLEGYQCVQFATWEVSPIITSKEQLRDEFIKDPVFAEMEYGAHFGNPAAQFVPEAVINLVPVPGRSISRFNNGTIRYCITLDPGGKAKRKAADTYAIAWGHYEYEDYDQNKVHYYVDGMHGFDAELRQLPGGAIEQITVDPDVVINFVLDLVRDLGGANFIDEIAFDQFESTAPVSRLQSVGLPAIETTFTNKYKMAIFGALLSEMETGHLHMYGDDAGGYVARWKLEMKYLQRVISGNYIFYSHPTTGPVQHDDFASVVANLVYRLSLRAKPTKQTTQELARKGSKPVYSPQHLVPIAGPRLFSTGGVTPIDRLRKRGR